MFFYFEVGWSIVDAGKVPGTDRIGANNTLVRNLFASSLIEADSVEPWLLPPSTNIS